MTWLDALGWAGSALLVYSVMPARALRFRGPQPGRPPGAHFSNGALHIEPMVGMKWCWP